MAPAGTRQQLASRKGAIKNHEIHIACEQYDISDIAVVPRLCIGDIGNRSTAVLDTISGSAIGMIKCCRANCYIRAWPEDLPGFKITVLDIRLKTLDLNRKQGRAYELS